jgi:hypothetical protein
MIVPSETRCLAIAGVSERDMDLLLLEELVSSTEFQHWFLTQCLGEVPEQLRCLEVGRSIRHVTGESDLEILCELAGGAKHCLLVENKVGAGFQEAQAARYVQRAESYVKAGRAAAFSTVLVAPQRYFGADAGSRGFDSRISYEQIRDWYLAQSGLGARARYKVQLLNCAIEKGTLGYQPVEDAPTTSFWRDYWLLATAEAPELEMPEPANKPSGSTFIYFRPSIVKRGTSICHKFTRGFVDLQLAGMGARLNEVRIAQAKWIASDMHVVQAGKSAAIRLLVPKLDPAETITSQSESVRVGLRAAMRLLDWTVAREL